MISVRNVSKSFKVQTVDDGGGFGGGSSRSSVRRTAVRDVSFDVAPGETVGIVGHNGAGKSTLLKLVAGILRPDTGTVRVRGEVTPILGLQAGFAPDLTGLENLYVKGAALGLTDKEIDARVDEIADYARIGEAMHQPLRTYSSGMRMRLAFAITFLETPEVLIVDETVAVGDAVFRRKSMARIEEIKKSGATILLVSHGTHLLQGLCDRVLVMDRGELLLDAEPDRAVEAYDYLMCAAPDERETVRRSLRERASIDGGRSGSESGDDDTWRGVRTDVPDDLVVRPETHHRSQGARIVEARFVRNDGRRVWRVERGREPRVECRVAFLQPARDVSVTLYVASSAGGEAASLDLAPENGHGGYFPGGEEALFVGTLPELPAGRYVASADVFGYVGPDHHHLHGVQSLAAVRITEEPVDTAYRGEAEPAVDTRSPLFFIQVPWAVGGGLKSALARSLGERFVALDGGPEEGTAPHALERDLRRDAVVYGPFAFGLHERIGVRPRYATVLRHPVDRVLSWYRHQVSTPEAPYHDLARRATLREILEDGSAPEASNHMTALLSGRAVDGPYDDEAFRIAEDNLRHFEFVPPSETLSRDVHVLESVLGARLPATEGLDPAATDRDRTMDDLHVLLRYNLLDLRLYELIRHLRNAYHGEAA